MHSKQHVTVPPLTLSLTPAQMGITDYGDIIYIAERDTWDVQ